MFCERCHTENDVVRPFRIVLRASERYIGYLKLCTTCYYIKRFLDTITIIGLVILPILAVYILSWGYINRFMWISYAIFTVLGAVEVNLIFYATGNLGYRWFKNQVTQNENQHAEPVEMICFRDWSEKSMVILSPILKMIFYIFFIPSLWTLYIKSRSALSSGPDHSNYYELAHYSGDSQTISPVSQIGTNPLPYVALFVLCVITALAIWSFYRVLFHDLLNNIKIPTRDAYNKLKHKYEAGPDAMEQSDRMVYSDPQFTSVDNYMTYIVFGGGASELAASRRRDLDQWVNAIGAAIEVCLNSPLFHRIPFLRKVIGERARGDLEKPKETKSPRFPFR